VLTLSRSPITPTTPVFSEMLKDITNKESTTSPRTLRNIASKLSLSGRKKSLQQEKEMAALDKIEEQAPSKLLEIVEADTLPETLLSMSRRRGFRPLSIHTGKAFDPFGFGGGAKPEPKNTNIISNSPETIEADFTTLASCARKHCAFDNTHFILIFVAPLITHHPLFQRDPFSAKSPSPLLKTTSSPLQIRQSRDLISLGQDPSRRSSGESESVSFASRNKFLFDSRLKAPNEKDVVDPLDLILTGSPINRTRPSAIQRESFSVGLVQNGELRKSTSSDTNAASVDSTRRSRGISSWFRQREKSAGPSNKRSGAAERNLEGGGARDIQVS
jgi:hypothetical protein